MKHASINTRGLAEWVGVFFQGDLLGLCESLYMCVCVCVQTQESPLNQQGSGVNLEVIQWPLSSESWLRNASLSSDHMERQRSGVPTKAELQTLSFRSSSLRLSHWGSVSDLAPHLLQRNTSQTGTTMVLHRRRRTPGGALKALLHNRNSAVGLGRQFSCCCETDKSRPQERKCRPPLFLIDAEAIFVWLTFRVCFFFFFLGWGAQKAVTSLVKYSVWRHSLSEKHHDKIYPVKTSTHQLSVRHIALRTLKACVQTAHSLGCNSGDTQGCVWGLHFLPVSKHEHRHSAGQ